MCRDQVSVHLVALPPGRGSWRGGARCGTRSLPHPPIACAMGPSLSPRGEGLCVRGAKMSSDGSGVLPDAIKFLLDGVEVEALAGETIWQAASRKGTEIPHLCFSPAPGYRPDGNCRACMVEIEGERVLAASCIRKPTAGMKVKSASERAKASRKLVFELLVCAQPARPP